MWHSVVMTQAAPITDAPWIPDDSTLGARLALIRQRMGWNITEAARECGVHPESWRLWEQHSREPRRFTTIAMVIHSRTGVDPDWLVWGPNRPTRRAPDPTHTYVGERVVAKIGEIRRRDGRKRPHSAQIPRKLAVAALA